MIEEKEGISRETQILFKEKNNFIYEKTLIENEVQEEDTINLMILKDDIYGIVINY